MENDSPIERILNFIRISQDHHLKVTPQRVAIYKELLSSNAHPTADAVYQIVKREYPNISFDTVNRTLLTFSKIGIVDIVEIFGGARRFDPNVADHHHLHCTQCGKILDFSSRAFENLEVPEKVNEQFQVIRRRVVFRGICSDCRKDNSHLSFTSSIAESERKEKNNE